MLWIDKQGKTKNVRNLRIVELKIEQFVLHLLEQ